MNKEGRLQMLLLLVGIGLVGAMAMPAWALPVEIEVRTDIGGSVNVPGSYGAPNYVNPGGWYGPFEVTEDWTFGTGDGRWVVQFNVADQRGLLGPGETFQVTNAVLDVNIRTNQSGMTGPNALVASIIDDGVLDVGDYDSVPTYANVGMVPNNVPNNSTVVITSANLLAAVEDNLNAGRAWHTFRFYGEAPLPGPNPDWYYEFRLGPAMPVWQKPRLRIWYDIVSASTPKNPGDVDQDGFVGGADLTRILTNWGNSGVSWTDGDVDPYGDGITTGDDFIGGGDYTAVLTAWGTSYPPEGTAIPEPATIGLLLIGVLPWLRRR